MTQDESKRKAAEAALPYIKDVSILGVGTGSTVNHFIDCLADFNLTNDIKGAVPNILTILLSSTIQTNFSLAPAIIFSRVNAPPPPLINSFNELTSSAPST
jgi:hypothetical protein